MTRKARKAQPKGAASTGNAKRAAPRRTKKPATPTVKLTAKQEMFAAEYIVDWNATQAAIRAGYSAKNADKIGHELLGKTRVQDAVEKAKAAALERAGIRAETVLLEIAKLAFASQRRLIQISNEGELSLRPGDEITDADLDAVSDISFSSVESEREGPSGYQKEKRVSGRVKLHDKRAALADLSRYLRIMPEQLEITGKNGGPVQTEAVNAIPEEDRAQRLAALLTRAAAKGADAT